MGNYCGEQQRKVYKEFTRRVITNSKCNRLAIDLAHSILVCGIGNVQILLLVVYGHQMNVFPRRQSSDHRITKI
jgi:hypothetical protein